MCSVVTAVIFDFYGTLARWADPNASDYGAVFAALGYALDPEVLGDYFHRYDGVEHAEHSVSEDAYEAWVRERLRDLTTAGGVSGTDVEAVVDRLRQTDQGQMVAYPEAAATLIALRQAGLTVGVCSNWGWELNAYLDEVGLLHLVDAGITSARVERASRTRGSTPGRSRHSASHPPRCSSSAIPGSQTCVVRADAGWPRRTSGARTNAKRRWHHRSSRETSGSKT